MTRPTDVLVLGEANPDLVLRGDVVPRFGQVEQLLTSAELVIGGSGAITAHALARLGLATQLLAEVGDDVYGRFMRDQLSAARVDVSAIATAAAPTGLTVVLSDGDDRAMLTLPGAIDAPPPEWTSADDVPSGRHLHVASFFLQPRRAAALPALLRHARAAGLSISLDTNLDPTGAFAGLGEVLPHVDYLLPNAEEAVGIARAVAGIETDDLTDAARALADYGPTVVIKNGGRGALAVHHGQVLHEPGMPLRPVDTTGAGDTFDAGFIAALLDGADLPTAVRWGCAAGAAATQAAGGTAGQPTRAQLSDLATFPAQGAPA